MVQVIQQTRKQKIKMYMGLPKSKLAELLYNCNEVIEEMMAHQKPYVIAPQDKAERRKTVAAKAAGAPCECCEAAFILNTGFNFCPTCGRRIK
jgi:Zn finger protein HypA/HybF involved in hydrogenase expression